MEEFHSRLEAPRDEQNMVRSIAVDVPLTDEMVLNWIKQHKKESPYYDSVEESMNIANQNYEREVVHEDIWRFESDEAIILVQIVVEKIRPLLKHNVFFKSDLGFSVPYLGIPASSISEQYMSPLFARNLMEEVKIADFLTNSFIWELSFKYANQGKPIYYGIAEDENIYNLRILGDAPTNIIPFEYNGKIYFYWFYVDVNFLDEVRGKVDFSNMTLGEIVEILDIHFVQE